MADDGKPDGQRAPTQPALMHRLASALGVGRAKPGLAHWLIPNDRLTPTRSTGLLAAFAGVLAAFADRVAAPDAAGLLGDLLCMLGAFFWGATTIAIKTTRLRSAPPEKNLLYQLGVSAVMLIAAGIVLVNRGR